MSDRINISALILAAGASTRLGEPKQLLPYRGTNLLGNVIWTARDAGFASISVVLGANEQTISQSIEDEEIQLVINRDWQEGMASSLRVGLRSVSSAEAILVLLCDQPKVTSAHLRTLAAHYHSGKIICSKYLKVNGVPAIFPKKYFAELDQLSGDEGARKIIGKYSDRLISVECPGCGIDIDEADDLAHLI